MKHHAISIVLGLMTSVSTLANPSIVHSNDQSIQIAEFQEGATDDLATGAKFESESNIYIIRMSDPSTAIYEGGIAGLEATSNAITGAKLLDVNANSSKRYATFLKDKQAGLIEHCEQAFGRDIKVRHKYQYALNGVAAELSEEEAKMISRLPGVEAVVKDSIEHLTSDVGPQWIGADTLWGQGDSWNSNDMKTRGEGMVVAIFDSGLNSDHPSFADVGDDGYVHENPLGKGNYIPGSYCDVTKPEFCNDKVIGAWSFTDPAIDPISPEDNNGHGSHVASTVAGNVIHEAIISAPTTEVRRALSGVAPHANIIVYDVCYVNPAGRGFCRTSSTVAALEQVIKDAALLPNGIQALNYSISGGLRPYSDPVELGFLNASAAGIFVSTSAGNNGPDASTVAHASPWVATVAATTHNRKYVNVLENIAGDEGQFEDIVAQGLTAGYGPAPIVYAGNFPTENGSKNDSDPAQCLDPFPAGHFNGQIVVCDRGSISRVAKGANVLAGGAGGLVLANAKANGDSTVGDSHFLPAVHIGFNDGVRLKDWLLTQTNPVASISGSRVDLSVENADVMAGFSSRGPYLAFDVLKPDIAAPGVGVLAAVDTDKNSTGPEYGFLSGTSMAAPHNAGAATLISALRPDWTPYEIKSAMMLASSNTGLRKEDGTTPADNFDYGAGRVSLDRISDVRVVLNETPENFLASDPKKGGDPKTLNIASMYDGNCVDECTWERTIRNPTDEVSFYALDSDARGAFSVSVDPYFVALLPGEEIKMKVRAKTALAGDDWHFANINFDGFGIGNMPNLHMPVAVKRSTTTDANLMKMKVDKESVEFGGTVSYEVDISNDLKNGVIEFSSRIPPSVRVVRNSLEQDVSKGETVGEFSLNRRVLSWSGELEKSKLELEELPSPAGYVSLADFVKPRGCPSDCDDGSVLLRVPEFTFKGQKYTEVIWSVNGTLQVGSEGRRSTSARSVALPSITTPNSLLAPFWTDLNMGKNGDGAEWYTTTLTIDGTKYTVYEWNNVPLFSDANNRYTFQVWIQTGDTENIWYVYKDLGTVTPEVGQISVGVEDATGQVGDSYFYKGEGTAPSAGVDLHVKNTLGGTAKLKYKARVGYCRNRASVVINRATLTTDTGTDRAIAVTRCKFE